MNNLEKELWLFEKISKIELEHHLFDAQIDGIYYWKIIRQKLFSNLLSGRYEPDRLPSKTNLLQRARDRLEFIKSSVSCSSFRRRQRKDILVFENPRKVRGAAGYIDPFTWDFIEELRLDKRSFEIVDLGFRGQHYQMCDCERTFAESLFWDLLYKRHLRRYKKSIRNEAIPEIKILEKAILDEVGIRLRLVDFILGKIADFRYQQRKFTNLFQIKKPKEIFLVCSYGKEGMIHAARELGIRVAEFQHGVMSRYQLGYSYPPNIQVPYFPDRLLLFGKYWQDATPLPTNVAIDIVGHRYLTDRLSVYLQKETREKRVLVLSQPGSAEELVALTIRHAIANSEFLFTYRLHPKERSGWENKYINLSKNSHLGNLVIDTGQDDLYSQMAKSAFVVGVSSAAIFEGIMLGCRTVVVNSSGIVHMRELISQGYVALIETQDTIDFETLKIKEIADTGYFYSKRKGHIIA